VICNPVVSFDLRCQSAIYTDVGSRKQLHMDKCHGFNVN